MKKIFNITLVLFAAILLISCRNGDNDIPEDIHEHEEIGKVVLKLTNKADASEVHTVNIIAGVADGHPHLAQGATYLAEVDFQVKHDDHYHSSEDILEEKDHHFITYSFANSDIKIIRSANDVVRTDGKKLGLKTEWTVNSTSSTGKVNIKLNHGATSVDDNYPSADNQLGRAIGGESDVDVIIDLH